VTRKLDDLDQPAVWRHAAEDHPRVAQRLAVFIVELEPVTVALVHHLFTICLVSKRTGQKLARVQPQAHRCTHLVDVPLLRHEVDDRCRRKRGKLGGVGVGSVECLSREVDDSALQPEA
jgi:hypothetical protein